MGKPRIRPIEVVSAEVDRVDRADGAVYRTRLARRHSVEMAVETDPLRRSILNIPLTSSASGVAKVAVNGEPAATQILPGTIRCDITHLACGRRRSSITLDVELEAEEEAVEIVDPAVIQEWSNPYSAMSAALLLMLWGIVVGGAVYGVALFLKIEESLRFYTVIGIAASGILGMAGIAEWSKLPLLPIMRRIFGAIRRLAPAPQRLALAGVGLAFVAGAAAFGDVVYCLAVRHAYTQRIRDAIAYLPTDSAAVRDEVKQAFVLVPERREAQILFEAAAFPLRPNKPEFRKFVRRFIDNDAVRNAARNKRPLPRYLVADTTKTFPSPAFWYAAILPEGEGEREQAFKNEAVTILRGIGGDEADLQRRVIEVSLSQNDPAALAQATANLEAAVNAPGDAANTFTFQVACDMLAQVRLNACAAQAVNVDACQTQACSLFRMILKIRQDQAQVGQLSTRPASKLSLFYLFLAQAGQGGNTDSDNFAKERLANAGFAEVFRRELFESNKAFHDQATWNAQTALDKDVGEFIQKHFLNNGWRY